MMRPPCQGRRHTIAAVAFTERGGRRFLDNRVQKGARRFLGRRSLRIIANGHRLRFSLEVDSHMAKLRLNNRCLSNPCES